MSRYFLFALVAPLAMAATTPRAGQYKTIDIHRSTITIHVGKAGLFSAVGHEHWVSAPIASGEISDLGARHVIFAVDAHSLKVKPDPNVNPKDEMQIQETMQDRVLESGIYPLIQFRSSNVAQTARGSWRITGELTLHGVSKSIEVSVKQVGDANSGNAFIKQTDFGIQPVSVLGGAVKVKDELEVHFDIYTIPK